jgi:hypothetical protein
VQVLSQPRTDGGARLPGCIVQEDLDTIEAGSQRLNYGRIQECLPVVVGPEST